MSRLSLFVPDPLFRRLWSLRRRLGLSPTQKVFREMNRRGAKTSRLSAVEVFAGTGFRHSIDYLHRVASLEAWEVNPEREAELRRNLPGAKIRITDSFEEIARTEERFGIVVVDNTITTFGEGRVEHFDLFPSVFRVADETCHFVLNVCPEVPPALRDDRIRMARRSEFYGTNRPEAVPIDRMVEVYRDLMREHGYRLDWHFGRRRAIRAGIHYLVMRMTRSRDQSAATRS